MRAPKAETGLLKPSNVKGLTDLLQIQAITGIGFSSLPASSSTCPIGLLSVFSRIKQSHSTASVYVGLDMGKQKKHLEGRLFTGFLAETEGFEPSIQVLPECSLSRGVPSTSRPHLQRMCNGSWYGASGQTESCVCREQVICPGL